MNRPPFKPFDEQRAVRIYQRALPHWRPEGATYFVTFRLDDSVPVHVSKGWEDDRRRWLAARVPGFNPRGHNLAEALARLSPDDQYQYHKNFNRRLQECLDRGIGECHLRDPTCTAIVRSQLLAGDSDYCHVGDFVVMPNHVHVLIVPEPGKRLEEILRRMKGASSRNCNLQLDRTGQLWQPESYDHIVRSLEQLLAYRDYIATNPRKAGISISRQALYRAEWMDKWFTTQHGL